ncbi:chloride channel protein [Holotrichia oblita]|uniref:Chloride channel protein n=1 Tax=Holotrichia oblita TaxID=644536 RepID=A0ACB9TY96_HOLOL|nr:chloride channel protein [Holotrichia oblita]
MDSDSDYITTYSADERIAKYLELQRLNELELNGQNDEERRLIFEKYYDENCDDEDSILRRPGLYFVTFRHTKIKFKFQPSEIVWTNRNIFFYCSLRYRRNNWVLKRDTLPANCKGKIYNLFYKHQSFSIDDSNIMNLLLNMYEILVNWSKEHEEFRLKRYDEYQKGLDIYLYKDEEELFLTEAEIKDLHRKRNRILRRMLVPTSY